jgi:acyl-CoA dehydrogenase
MNETVTMLADAATRLFGEHLDEAAVRRAAKGEWLGGAWAAIEAMGLPLALLPEDRGGFGIDPADALALVRLAGFHAAPLPIGETMLANRVLAAAGLPLVEGGAAIVPAGAGLTLAKAGGGWHLSGTAPRVPWSGTIGTLLVETAGKGGRHVVRLPAGEWRTITTGANLAGHPRDTIAIDAAVEHVAPFDRDLLLGSAALRTILIAGALDRVLELTAEHVDGRVQFGRALAKFQAVQHECAQIAGEVAAAGAAADIAIAGLGRPADAARLAIASAKLRAGEAVGVAVGLAHQLHGAIGFTAEHRLHLFTTALWSWREEYGGHAHWTRIVGEQALAAGPDGFWPLVTAA